MLYLNVKFGIDRPFEDRDWGGYTVLYEIPGVKIKVLEILDDATIPAQYHVMHDEAWLVLRGSGQCYIAGKLFYMKPGDIFEIPHKTVHNVIGGADLAFLEIQQALVVPGEDAIMVEDESV